MVAMPSTENYLIQNSFVNGLGKSIFGLSALATLNRIVNIRASTKNIIPNISAHNCQLLMML